MKAVLADLGVAALPATGSPPQCRQADQPAVCALPNKFFEYVVADLAVCTTDQLEMVRLIRRYNTGITLAEAEPQSVAAAINAFDANRIDRFKHHAFAAARELCWERESEPLVAAYFAALQLA